MRKLALVLVGPLLLGLSGLLGGCSDFDEMKSQRLLLNAQHQLTAGDEAQGEELLTRLLDAYPQTRAAGPARQELELLRTRQELAERQRYAPILDSYRNVFSAYRSVYGRYPLSAAELNREDFPFDTSYLAEITPPGYRAYLHFTGEEDGFRLWCLEAGAARGYLADGWGNRPQAVARAELEAEVAADFLPLRQFGNLTILGRKP
jgi:hypothetical protein